MCVCVCVCVCVSLHCMHKIVYLNHYIIIDFYTWQIVTLGLFVMHRMDGMYTQSLKGSFDRPEVSAVSGMAV